MIVVIIDRLLIPPIIKSLFDVDEGQHDPHESYGFTSFFTSFVVILSQTTKASISQTDYGIAFIFLCHFDQKTYFRSTKFVTC
jgi:hypothetical protein